MSYLIAQISSYPGSTSTAPGGLVLVTSSSTSSITLHHTLTKLPPSTIGGLHVHSSLSLSPTCSSSQPQGHFLLEDLSDPWPPVVYSSDPESISTDLTGQTVSGLSTSQISSRPVVLHNSSGDRIGCGILTPQTGYYSTISPFHSYDGLYAPTGIITISDDQVKGTLTDLPPSTCVPDGLVFHEGHSCENPGSPLSWTGGYCSGGDGVAEIDLAAAGRSAGLTLVVRDGTGQRVGCGVVSGSGVSCGECGPGGSSAGVVIGVIGIAFLVIVGVVCQRFGIFRTGKEEERDTIEMLSVGVDSDEKAGMI